MRRKSIMRFDKETSIRLVARSLIDRFGASALKIVQDRIAEYNAANEERSVAFWRSVESAIRRILKAR